MDPVLARVSVFWTQLTRIPVTLAYAMALTTVTVVLLALGPQVQDRVVSAASTNLHNLRHGHFGTLVGSAFVTDAGPIYGWMPGLVCLLALAELFWRSRRLIAMFAFGHIGATVLVAIGLTVAVKAGWTPGSVSHDIDVGMSYGAAAVLGALTAAIPRRWRTLWIGWWLAVALAVVAVSRYFTDVGHVTALGLGMLVATRLGRPGGWTTPRRLMLAFAGLFGLMLLAGTGGMVLITVTAGLLGAGAGYGFTQLTSRRSAGVNSTAAMATHSDAAGPPAGLR
ncbi:hypothetical protein OKHIL_51050 [Mycolicibacterium mageritense]|nr:hypothetical protein MTY414_04590 [Mycolicibacterium mageritense]